LNSYLTSRIKGWVVPLIIGASVKVLAFIRFVWSQLMRLETMLERAILGDESDEMLWTRFRRRLRQARRQALVLVFLDSKLDDDLPEAAPAPPKPKVEAEEAKPDGTTTSKVQWGLRVLGWYKAALKWVQDRIKELVSETKDDLWPWVVAFAGYRLQKGELRILQVPGCVGGVFAYPVKRIAMATRRPSLIVLGLAVVFQIAAYLIDWHNWLFGGLKSAD
jgi:hypothetical protein